MALLVLAKSYFVWRSFETVGSDIGKDYEKETCIKVVASSSSNNA